MVIVLDAQFAFTPEGNPDGDPIPVASVVAWVMLVSGVLIQSVGVEEGGPAVMSAVTVIVPVALTEPHPPVRGME